VVNVSSPNTPGLRALQEKEPLTALLQHLQNLNYQKKHPKPILLKIAPDLTNEQLEEIVDIVKQTNIAGVIATNTTISRNGLQSDQTLQKEFGGLSGLPLKSRSTEVIKYLRKRTCNELIIIGSGGIFTAADAQEKLDAGANLIQVYTGFIYEGPSIVKVICRNLVNT
jgi:dihydroorotate dehydrogenase